MPAALQLDYGPELARARIAERVRHKQHQAWNKAKRTGIAFVGPRRLLACGGHLHYPPGMALARPCVSANVGRICLLGRIC